MITILIQPLGPADEHLEAEWRRIEKRVRSNFFTSWDWVGTLFASLPATCSLSLLRLSEGATLARGRTRPDEERNCALGRGDPRQRHSHRAVGRA